MLCVLVQGVPLCRGWQCSWRHRPAVLSDSLQIAPLLLSFMYFFYEEEENILFPPRVQGKIGKLPYLLLCWLVGECSYSLYRFYLTAVPRRPLLSTQSALSTLSFATRAQRLLSESTEGKHLVPDKQGGSVPSKPQGQCGFSSLLVSGYFHLLSCGLSCSFRQLVLFYPAGSCKHFT